MTNIIKTDYICTLIHTANNIGLSVPIYETVFNAVWLA